MYLPAAFEQSDPAALQALMVAHPLATLVLADADGQPQADHLPLLFDPAAGPHGTLRGHVARGNPLWRVATSQPAVLAIFHGPQAYVSPTAYPGKAQHHQVVPTWNYAVVHAHGRLQAIDDAVWLRGMLARLTARHEEPRAVPWKMADAPVDYMERQLAAVVGIEIPLSRLSGKWKMSQNRNAAERQGVIAALGTEAPEVAALMRGASAPQG
jgi:transcriptional regulator